MSKTKEKAGARTCGYICSWIIMILLWISILLAILAFLTKSKDFLHITLFFLGFVYLVYVISAFCSRSFSYLINNHKAESIHAYMKKMFYTPPNITWNIECYHYETRTTENKKADGTIETTQESVKVVTHSSSQSFNYYSWRDISGLFVLESHKIFLSQKYYIKLELEKSIEFADDITKTDYQRQKDYFYNSHRWRDTHVSFTENRHIIHFNQFNMVKISNEDPAYVNVYVYLLFVFILPFVEFYKKYVDQFCIEQDYKLTKIISTRYDLNQSQYFLPYQHLIPELAINDQPRKVYSDQTVLIHDSPDIPSLDELDEAKIFSNGNDLPGEDDLNNDPQNYRPHYIIREQENGIQYTHGQNHQNASNNYNLSYDVQGMNEKQKFI